MSAGTLVAGVGNIFLGDDGFGVEVARRLAQQAWPENVRVADFGIRGIHLAYQLLDGYETLILVDAMQRGGPPGTLYVMEAEDSGPPLALADAHGMDPRSVLGMVRTLGGSVGRVLVVGCEPAETGERIGLSEPVERAATEAVRVVRTLVEGGSTCSAS
jgi:hydrogenase maturation protease